VAFAQWCAPFTARIEVLTATTLSERLTMANVAGRVARAGAWQHASSRLILAGETSDASVTSLNSLMEVIRMRTTRALIAGTLVTLAACGGGGDDGGTAPAVFTTLAVSPTSANLLVGGTQTITPTARDQNGGTMSGLTAVTYTTGSQAIATVTNAGVVSGVAVGTTAITVSGTIGTVTKTATVNVSVIVPGATASVDATLSSQFSPPTAFITRNGTVTWTFAMQHNVTFDGAGAPADIPNTTTGSVSRTFPNAGTFAYHCTIHAGMTGSVVVQ
jgi:plastocyanin